MSAFLCASIPLIGQDVDGWDLVWSDEFDLPDGSAPDPANWNYAIGDGCPNLCGWGNAELQYYTDRTENVRIENGELVIQVHNEPLMGYDYTSGRLLTQDKWDWAYGRIEARIKVPAGTGLWPAFWMLGSDINEVGWPQSGEIDIMEFVGREPNEIFGTIHGPGYSGAQSIGNDFDFGVPVSDEYHTFWVEWTPELIRWYVDGIFYHRATPEFLRGNEWVFDHPHYILLNVAVGGNFGGPVSSRLQFPLQMNVDYVRVYELVGDVKVVPLVISVPGRVLLEDYTDHSGLVVELTGGASATGYHLTSLDAADWGDYTLRVPQAGTYNIDMRYASPDGTGSVTLTTDSGVNLSSSGLTSTGSLVNFETTTLGEISLPAGDVTLRMTVDEPGLEGMKLNWFELSLVELSGTWAGYPVDENGFADTGSFLGFVYVGGGPWVWVLSLDSWMYLPEQNIQPSGSWGYLAN